MANEKRRSGSPPAPVLAVPANRGLEVQLHAQLHNAGIAGRRHRVIQRGGEVGGSAANGIGVIESVERFPAELSGEALAERYVFEQREVGAPEAGAANGTGALRGF